MYAPGVPPQASGSATTIPWLTLPVVWVRASEAKSMLGEKPSVPWREAPCRRGSSHSGTRIGRGVVRGPTSPARFAGYASRSAKSSQLQFKHDGATPGLDRFHLHLRCFAAWEFERNKA